MNNGVDDFIGNETRVRIFRDCLTLANSGSVGSCFYHAYAFVGSDHVTHLKCEGLSPFQYLFVSVMCSKLSDKYNFNREINDKRISRETIMLPATSQGKPNFAYMEAYGRKIVREHIMKYLAYRKSGWTMMSGHRMARRIGHRGTFRGSLNLIERSKP